MCMSHQYLKAVLPDHSIHGTKAAQYKNNKRQIEQIEYVI